ncbi:MAG: hypothetical protein ACKOXJ_00665 [Alphaproteobacteria bacterium]
MKNGGNGENSANKNNSCLESQSHDQIGLADQAFAMDLDNAVHFRGNSASNSLNESLQSPKSNETSSSSYSTSSSGLSSSRAEPLTSTSVQVARRLGDIKERLSKTYP